MLHAPSDILTPCLFKYSTAYVFNMYVRVVCVCVCVWVGGGGGGGGGGFSEVIQV